MAVSAIYLLAAGDGFLSQAWSALGRNQILALPVFAFALGCVVRRARNQPPGSVVPQSVPPHDITPAESGMLLRGHVGSLEVAATLVDLSAKKYLSVVDATPERDGPPNVHDLAFRLLRPEAEWQKLARHEKTLLRQAFRENEWATLGELRRLLPEIVPAVEEEVKSSLWEKGMTRTDPSGGVMSRWKGFAYLASLMGMLYGVILGQLGLGLHLAEYPGLAFLMIAITMGIVVWALQDPVNSTNKGVQTQTYLEGLRLFIATVDADRLQRLDRYQFDAVLPYAILFGIEQKWAGAFRQLTVQPSEWFGDADADSLLRGSRLTMLSTYLQPFEWKR
jgi:Predicted membrane protein (DUF2207)